MRATPHYAGLDGDSLFLANKPQLLYLFPNKLPSDSRNLGIAFELVYYVLCSGVRLRCRNLGNEFFENIAFCSNLLISGKKARIKVNNQKFPKKYGKPPKVAGDFLSAKA
ncbi:hypothetical protein UH38_02220 [Aliterella atlantica CENA595]|uniref:Uncharacterized protein n=1 Tax=Aliterella atlantica CENA595 TaxID=1618023 RepID=A0A0D8ZXT6_9CYAN|nr:hypothetical protein UH38_02220 [Aliterella atlantica CENA595]